MGLEDGRKGFAHAQHAIDVGFKKAAGHFFAVVRQKAAGLGDACVVDDQRYIVRQRRRSRHVFRLVDVELQCLYPGHRDGGRVARCGVHLAGATGEQFARKTQADATIGTGDKNHSVFDFHGELQNVRGEGERNEGRGPRTKGR
ncbi:hypothetical protein D3C71_1555000 [compost metagenome]